MSSTLPPLPPTIDASRFIEPVPNHFLCCVCWEVPLDPLVHSAQKNCDVVICQRCRNEINSRHGTCPQCRKGGMHEFSSLHRLLRVNYFEKMKLRCDRTKFCKAVLNMETFKTHDQTCIGLELECPVCNLVLPRFKMAKHVLESGLQHVHFFTESHFARKTGITPIAIDRNLSGAKRPHNEIEGSEVVDSEDSDDDSSESEESSVSQVSDESRERQDENE